MVESLVTPPAPSAWPNPGAVGNPHGGEVTGTARRASSMASRRSVLMRSPEGRAIEDGATTSQCRPCAVRWRQMTKPQGPAS